MGRRQLGRRGGTGCWGLCCSAHARDARGARCTAQKLQCMCSDDRATTRCARKHPAHSHNSPRLAQAPETPQLLLLFLFLLLLEIVLIRVHRQRSASGPTQLHGADCGWVAEGRAPGAPAGVWCRECDDLGVGVAEARALGSAAQDERTERPHALRVRGAGCKLVCAPRAAQAEHVHGARRQC